jgi:hypothetical protein
MLTDGTLAMLARQVAAGKVTLIYLDGVGRDFAKQYPNIYHARPLNPSNVALSLCEFTNLVLGNVRTALETLSAAGIVKFILENIADYGVIPYVIDNWQNFLGLKPGETVDPVKKQLNTDAIQVANARLAELADDYAAPLVRQFEWLNRVALDPCQPPILGGIALDSTKPTFFNGAIFQVVNPLGLWVDVNHQNPAPQGLKANVVLDAIQTAYGVHIPRLSDQEILTYAYERAGQTPPTFTETTYFDLSGFVHFNPRPGNQLGLDLRPSSSRRRHD